MYDPRLAQLSYLKLYKMKGRTAACQSLILVVAWSIFNAYLLDQEFSPLLGLVGFIVFAMYFTWKPKMIRFLRGVLRGQEFRDKADD